MASKRKKNNGIYSLPEDERLKREAYGIAMYGTAEEFNDPEEEEGGNTSSNLVIRNAYGAWPSSFEVIDAPTSDKTGEQDKRNRALECGYHRASETLVIMFRAPVKKNKLTGRYDPTGALPPMCKYHDVTEDMWEDLKGYGSTGKWLVASGLNDLGASGYEYTSFPDLNLEFK